jgi:hypothetical protein
MESSAKEASRAADNAIEYLTPKKGATAAPSPASKTTTPISKPLSVASEPFMPSPTPPNTSTSSEIRKLQDRVRTLEGRQGALQSKITAADSVLGRTGPSWQQSLQNMHDSCTKHNEVQSNTSAMEQLLKRVETLEVSR